MKKGEGLSMETIVIAVLVLLVLVVLVLVFTGSIEKIRVQIDNMGKCENQGQEASCISEDDSCTGVRMKMNCPEKQLCCIPKEEK